MSAVRLVRAALPHLTRGSAILTVTSSSIREPIARLGLSTVMRAGVAGFVKTLADELAGEGIRVNNLLPGGIDTERVAQLDRNTAANLGITPEEARRRTGVSEMRMVSPMPCWSSTESAAVDATMPLEPMPASVSPRCSA